MIYREATETVREVTEWDIVLMHGRVKVIGMTLSHLDRCVAQEFGAKCKCQTGPVISSAIVDPNTHRVLEEAWWSHEPNTGEARYLLEACDGDEIPVESGKVYRLVGERKSEGYESYRSGSIFVVYRDEELKERPVKSVSIWTRLRRALPWSRAS